MVGINDKSSLSITRYALVEVIFSLVQGILAAMKVLLGLMWSKVVTNTWVDERLFTAEELALYNGTDTGLPILLGILGSVFDVTKGKSHYGVGGGYSHFSGRDASRAFVSGNFTGEGLTDNLHGLSSTEVKSIVEWRDFYIRTYIFVGKLVGRYYNNDGNPTKYLKGVEAKAARGAQLLEKQKKEEDKLASCNSKWSQEEGSEVWCDKGYPRLVQRPLEIALTGKMSKRCACFEEDQLGQADYILGLGFLDIIQSFELQKSPIHAPSRNPKFKQKHPNSDSLTLTVYYGAHAVHIPEANCVGGSVAKFDYASAKECCLQSLDKFCDSVGVSKDMRYYIILNKEFKLILDNNDIRKEYMSRLLHREMIVNVESLERVEGERDDYVAEGAVVRKGLRVLLGLRVVRVGEGGEDEMGEADQMIDSDYEMGEGNNQERPKETETVEKNVLGDVEEENRSSESEIDVVNNDGDLDEIRDELCNEDRPIYPVFNLEQIWELTFELGMRFSRLYVCFGALKVGFKYGYIPIIGVDGCHLKGPHGGILLTACGVDPNNSLFPIAYAVVNKESRETWEWFLIILKHDLNIVRQDEFTFMFDKQKGLI
ncbi:Membrane-associated progesterone-binding protein 4 [Sesamum angolense]|uniref:Membrane-associated progesterone-binding protein 4 n=1 Tax=Sesamum angolense TaxID=2727404 RepID=A0AAE2BM12_9LAMI|nr:Membrane-associated progesterone-binding protein 4 [Sesamum angolense]